MKRFGNRDNPCPSGNYGYSAVTSARAPDTTGVSAGTVGLRGPTVRRLAHPSQIVLSNEPVIAPPKRVPICRTDTLNAICAKTRQENSEVFRLSQASLERSFPVGETEESSFAGSFGGQERKTARMGQASSSLKGGFCLCSPSLYQRSDVSKPRQRALSPKWVLTAV